MDAEGEEVLVVGLQGTMCNGFCSKKCVINDHGIEASSDESDFA